jgi:hypothetical protein
MAVLSLASARRLRRGIATLLLAGLALAGASARAELSPELMSILNEMQGKLVVDFATDPRSRTDCQKEVINLARAAMNYRNISSAAEKSGQILIAALEHTCKFYLDLAGLGAVSTTYSVAKCFYEYLDDASNDAGFIACLVGEAFGAGVGKAGEKLLLEDVRQAVVGRVTDAGVDAIKGGIESRRGQISNHETDFSETTLGDGCQVQMNIVWRKARNPVRAQRTNGNAGTITLTVSIRNCRCSLNQPYSQQLKNGSLVVTLPVNFVRNGASQPAWQADFPRMRTRLQAQCCTGAYSVLADPPRTQPPDSPATGTAGGMPTGSRGPRTGSGGGATGTPGAGTPHQQPPAAPPPRPGPPPVAQAPKPVPMADACPECVPLAAAAERAVAELERLRGKRPGIEDEIDRRRREAEDARSRIRSLEKYVQASKGEGGSSFDPETGITVSSYASGDGTVTVTTTARDGTVLEQHARDQSSHADAVKQVRAEREREAEAQLAEARAREKRAELDGAIANADTAIAAALRALEECLAACRRKGVLFEEPGLRLPEYGPATAARVAGKPRTGTRKGPGGAAAADPPAVALCVPCVASATVLDHARAFRRQLEADIERVRARMHALTGSFIDGRLKPTATDSEAFGQLKIRLRALDRALEAATAEVARADAALKECNDRCTAATAPPPPTGQLPGTGTTSGGFDFGARIRAAEKQHPEPAESLCTPCDQLARQAETEFTLAAGNLALLQIAEERLQFYNALGLGGAPQAAVPLPLGVDEFRAMRPSARLDFLRELQRRYDEASTTYQDSLADLDDAYRRLSACNNRCRATVTVDRVVNRVGANPFDPANPTGQGPTGTQPPQQPPQQPPENSRGTLRFTSPGYSGTEGGSVTLMVERVGGTAGVVGVSYAAIAGTATSGSDFQPAAGSLTWFDNDAAPRPITIVLPDDSEAEPAETFTVTLSQPTGASLAPPATATVSITDNDSVPPVQTGAVQFGQSSYAVAENAGAVTITVTRTGGSAGAASVRYVAVPGSASASLDFQAVSGTLSWTAGDAAPKTIVVQIVNDTVVEGTESFQVMLSAASGAVLGAPSAASLTIQDDDVATGPCGTGGNAWQANSGSPYICSGNCDPCPSPQTVTVSGDRVTISPFHAGGAATFTGCTPALNSDSATLTYFGQSNHRATITRSSNNAFSASIVSAGGGTCAMSCFRVGP